MIDGDPDPISAGTAGDAALWGGSSAAVGMAANPFGAHQAGRHRRPRDRLGRRPIAWHLKGVPGGDRGWCRHPGTPA